MRRTNVLRMAVLAVAGTVLCNAPALAAHDNFNRDALGSKWVVTAGSLYINNQQLQGDSESLGYYTKSANHLKISATLYLNGTDLEYGGIASGDIADGSNVFVKLQAQDGTGMFDHGAFYVGNNDGNGGSFFALDAPVPSPATVTLNVCGTVATMTVHASGVKQQYTYDYGASFGTGGGLGTFGLISLDDYKSKPGGCKTAQTGGRTIRHSDAKDLTLAK